MDTEAAIRHLKQLGYSITEPKKPKPIPNGCWRIEVAAAKGSQLFFMEGLREDESKIVSLYESKGYEVIAADFNEDEFFFL